MVDVDEDDRHNYIYFGWLFFFEGRNQKDKKQKNKLVIIGDLFLVGVCFFHDFKVKRASCMNGKIGACPNPVRNC